MTITVKYFASLREQVGIDQESVASEGISNVRELMAATQASQKLTDNTLVAINQKYGDFDSALSAGDEVAFFPPVTGG